MAIIFTVPCSSGASPSTSMGIPSKGDLTPREAWNLIQENRGNPNFVILDVRPAKAFFKERIAGAINLDFYALTFNEELGKLDPDKTYLVYCKSGQRSALSRAVMLKMGFKKVYNMLQGIEGWKRVGLPIVSGP